VSSVTATGRFKVIIKTPEASRARPEMVGQLDLSCKVYRHKQASLERALAIAQSCIWGVSRSKNAQYCDF
jgi:hypothetical protein